MLAEICPPKFLHITFSYVYILKSLKDGKMCIGRTNDLTKRLREHNQGKSFATKTRAPFEIIYFEGYRNRDDAEERERFFKTGWGRQYINKNLKHYIESAKT